ncbi:EAL domain-containing protein [Cellulomonas sp. ATA003]|uniref:EAL domain-containing protein n=1 Tax=Cellulomonas sp. ATA003 TaxID=3073064 RepID=UPI0028734CBE|nr:EAL domain-containing protein [Cellulomonas sp. ATA003]WNB84612.1 EAL domain-containing protein [Cellulomonas sp. ATA003]
MTADLAAIAAAVDSAVSDPVRAEWDRAGRRRPARLVSRGVYRACGRRYGHLVGPAEVPTQSVRGADARPAGDDRRRADLLRSTFRDLTAEFGGEPVFVRVTRTFLAGDLPVPGCPGQVVVEADCSAECDAVVRDGLLRLKSLGCRVALGTFTGRADQRRLLPFADFVTIDARDLDVEGRPLLDLAASRGAELVAEFVDTVGSLRECRAAGFGFMQGRALERDAPRLVPTLVTTSHG